MDVSTILKRASEKSGVSRFRYKEREVPTSVESVTVLPFFGDRRSSFVLSSLLIRRIRQELKGSRYFVLVSWPGDDGLYQDVDEYWQLEDESALRRLAAESSGFFSSSSFLPILHRSLNQYFYDVMSEQDLLAYYDNGLTANFFERFRHVKVALPSIPSVSSLGPDLSRTLARRDDKVFVRPTRTISSWRNGSCVRVEAPREFWLSLLERLVTEGFYPVVHRDLFSYDLSSDFSDSCFHLDAADTLKSMSAMRACGCVLDLFDGTSRLALAARCPFLCFDERQRFNALKEYELNDLCGLSVPKEYIFSFAALIEKGNPAVWKTNVFDHMVVKLRDMHARMDRDSWPPPVETNDIVPYDSVRKRKLKRLGSRFIKIERD
jgi:hypothetical protein